MLNAPASENPGQLGAIISSTQNLGSTVIRRGHVAYTINSQPSIYRYYEIVPSLNNNLNAVLRFHYLDEELHGHIEDDLTQWRTEDDMNWIEAGKSSGDISANYVELTQIASFAKHSLR